MTEPSLQERYAPQSICFGCGPANDKGVSIERSWFFSGETELGSLGANWRAEYAVYLLSR